MGLCCYPDLQRNGIHGVYKRRQPRYPHTLNEHVEISSIERAWLYLLEVLKHIK